MCIGLGTDFLPNKFIDLVIQDLHPDQVKPLSSSPPQESTAEQSPGSTSGTPGDLASLLGLPFVVPVLVFDLGMLPVSSASESQRVY